MIATAGEDDKWRRPLHLSDIKGQPCIRHLQAFVKNPRPRCFLLEGEPGVGKSATAIALAHELGADDSSWGGGYNRTYAASELSIEVCRKIFEETLKLRFNKWKVVTFEELDGLPSKQVERYLKVHLENLPERTVIVATSNGAGKLDAALLERFRFFAYTSCPSALGDACRDRLAEIWDDETDGAEMPFGWMVWGVVGDRFSMRKALDSLAEALDLWRMEQ